MVLSDTRATIKIAGTAPFGKIIRPTTGGVDITRIPVSTVRDLVREHRIIVLRGFDSFSDQEKFVKYAESWGQIMLWPFGGVLELVEHENPVDHVFDSSWMPFHWDGAFVAQIPEFQMFHCVTAPGEGQGGRTVFCDTTRMLANASAATRTLWEAVTVTYRIENKSHYGGQAVSPVVVPHPDRGYPTIRYAEPVPEEIVFHNRPGLEFDGVPAERVTELKQTLRDGLYDPSNCYAHSWETGDVVITDNYTLLHGREPYTSRCGRHLRRIHILGDPPLRNPALR
ncbi:MAG TPA: TauD/TfdA family dioxygenase [Micromonosporaceae bacterium]